MHGQEKISKQTEVGRNQVTGHFKMLIRFNSVSHSKLYSLQLTTNWGEKNNNIT